MTLTAPSQPADHPVVLHMEGRAVIDGNTVSRTAIAAEDMMQAFDYRHLVPVETLMAAIMEAKPRTPVMTLVENSQVDIPSGGTAQVQVRIPPRMRFVNILLELNEPPKGISLGDVNVETGLLTFTLKADSNEVQTGLTDNLIIEVTTDWPVGAPDDKGVRAKQRISLGVLPAIPFEIKR